MLFLCYRRGDYEVFIQHIYGLLAEAFRGQEIFDANMPPPAGSDFHEDLDSKIARSEVFVVMIAPDWLDAISTHDRHGYDPMRVALESALRAGKPIFPVLLGGAAMPKVEQLPPGLVGLAEHQYVEVRSGRESADMRELVVALERYRPARSARRSSASPASMSPPEPWHSTEARVPSQPTPSPSYGSPPRVGSPQAPPAPSAPRSPNRLPGVLASVLTGLRSLWIPKPVEPRAERVLLAASAPRSSPLGAEFTAALVAYVEEARASAHKKLADLGEAGDRRVDDIAAGAWRVGAPVTVRLTSEGATVTPPEVRFDWSGRENLAAFSVKVGSTPRDAVLLSFQILVADVLIAFVPMRVNLASSTDAKATQRVQGALPSSAFASYSSQDAEPVTQRLSTLSRWAPGLDIFQDCLDLTPGETFKPQLENQIARRDVFLLFWSRRAALSPWVRWEYTTALQRKGLGGILPMPLEDPAIAPPPPELADQHQRDRFMLAGYGLAKVREEAGRG